MSTYRDLLTLIPSHGLEDFPADLAEKPAEGLMNAFAVLWHPLLLADAQSFPGWDRADSPPELLDRRLIIVPTCCEDWLPHGWVDSAREAGATVVSGVTDRAEMAAAAIAGLPEQPTIDEELVADFLALGCCYLHAELLSRHMRDYTNLDEVRMMRLAVAAAKAAIDGDADECRQQLRGAFELLLEARERFYPVDCYLIDLCLLTADVDEQHFARLLELKSPLCLLTTAADLKGVLERMPQLHDRLRERVGDGTLEIIGGEWEERPTPQLALQETIDQLQRGVTEIERLTGKRPTTWGRRRFGVGVQMPQLLGRFGFEGALHIVMDDGIYPDEEQSRLRWEGCDGSIIEATSRIPLAADAAGSMIRFPQRMSESMDLDHVALVTFARWPELHTPWLSDIHRMAKYAPVLGRFTTFAELFSTTETPSRLSSYKAGEYLPPFFLQSVVRGEADAVSRMADYWQWHQRLSAVDWFRGLAAALHSREPEPSSDIHTLRLLCGPEAERDPERPIVDQIAEQEQAALHTVASVLTGGLSDRSSKDSPGRLLINPLSFVRRVIVDWPPEQPLPPLSHHVRAVQNDERHRKVLAQLPPCGFAWVGGASNADESAGDQNAAPLAEDFVLRNEFFEARISDITGGVSHLKTYRRGANRISQQLAFRFPRERTVILGEGDEQEQIKTHYSEMQLQTAHVLSGGPLIGEIETTGLILDQAQDVPLATFVQRTRVTKGKPRIDIDIEIDPQRLPDGDPWSSYYAIRFAWNDSTAALTQSAAEGAHLARGQRIESPHFLEIASEGQRTTLLTGGYSYHRRTGRRMVDTLLIVPGETRRRFSVAVAIDVDYPMQAALDWTGLTYSIPCEKPDVPAGWLFQLDRRNVQLSQVLPLMPVVKETVSGKKVDDEASHGDGYAVRLMETEGRATTIRLQAFRTPARARQRDLRGVTLSWLDVENDSVVIELTPYEVCDVELRFS